MKKLRHKWGIAKNNQYTTIQECEICGLYRFKALGIWMYSKDELLKENYYLTNTVANDGCQLGSRLYHIGNKRNY